jgi:tRNA (guanine-N7-)-methyltransferase
LQADSLAVTSNQHHIHPKLPALVRRYLTHRNRRPIAPHSRKSFEPLRLQLANNPRPLVLDSFCGTGHSTAILAERHPDHLVVGVDKSAHRLARHPQVIGDSYLLLQADCGDIWRLLLEQRISLEYHYLLYPNPWPKSGHLQRRVHGSPDFRSLLELGGRVELRSNWQLYVEEFGVAMHLAGHPGIVTAVEPKQPLTLFEHKYQASGHNLWAYTGQIKSPVPPGDCHSGIR